MAPQDSTSTPLRLTRRAFAGAAVSSFALTVLGCDNSTAAQGRTRPDRETLATEPFSIGSPQRYKDHRVYSDFRKSHGIWITSTFSSSGTMIVALSALCTHNACGTRYDPDINLFKCPCHGSRFTSDGLLFGTSGKAKRALERCRLDLVRDELIVKPSQRFRQDKNEWSKPYSLHIIDGPEHPSQDNPEDTNRGRLYLRPSNPFSDS